MSVNVLTLGGSELRSFSCCLWATGW